MNGITREYPQFAACGLNCGLCPRYYTSGSSRCPGCAGEGFAEIHPPCGVLSCCQRKEIEYCFQCGEYPCKRYDNIDSDSFISHKNRLRDLDNAKKNGLETYQSELNEKIIMLEKLLNHYDDGRKKSFYCTAVNLLELDDVKAVMKKIADEIGEETDVKEKAAAAARLFEETAAEKGVSLKLRKGV